MYLTPAADKRSAADIVPVFIYCIYKLTLHTRTLVIPSSSQYLTKEQYISLYNFHFLHCIFGPENLLDFYSKVMVWY